MSNTQHTHSENFLNRYVFSTDHKTIAKQFLITGVLWAIIGLGMSALFRLQLGYPELDLSCLKPLFGSYITEGGKLDSEYYLALITMHGTIMVFFVLTAGLSGTFSNLLIPLQLGARDMASGFLNMLSYWAFFLSSVVMLASLFVELGPASAGWTIYPPLSALPQAIGGSGLGMTLWLFSMALFIASVLLGGINYITTIMNLRTKGMSFMRMPLTIWSFLLAAILGLITFPVLLSAALLLIFDRSFGTSFYLSDIYIAGEALHHTGGSPLLFQHLFWFLGHPEVYIVMLPALGIASEVISVHSRKPIFGHKAMIGSLMLISFLSIVVWAHHMFVSGMNPFLGSVFMLLTLLIAIPSSVKTFNYLATLWRGNIRFSLPMLFAIGLVSFFISGGLTGLLLGNAVLDIVLHDTYFVVAHFHIVMGAASSFGLLTGIYHWYPKLFGRMLNERLGYIHFWISFIGIYAVFIPLHFVGLAGFPRRYYAFTNFDLFDSFTDLNALVTIAALVTFLGQVVFLFNFFHSMFYGRKAPPNPWEANTLEWTTPSAKPLSHGNWPGDIPEVHRWPYDYSHPLHKEDFVPQHIPLSPKEKEKSE
ncbi:MAG: cbb3-type cytochrome c oxidase subunit I [Cytophagales bacterium]|nr:cbb3-type cytochrome c oxidase subunit I [Cytophagales bacterium]